MPKPIIRTGALALALGLSLSGVNALALPSQANAHAQAAFGKATDAPSSSPEASPQTGQVNGQAHMEAAQLRACHNREQAIQNIMSRIVDRGTKQIALFGTIATRVEAFYTANGKTVADYSSLVAAISAAQAKAQTDLAAVKASDSFSCSSPDPKAMVTAFQSSLKTEIIDLQAYKTAVKNLIVAVKSVDASSTSPQPSESPKASSSPSPSPSSSPQGGN